MTTKQKPATPLPWFAGQLKLAMNNRDAEFSVHAANAYPRLVEALRGLLKDCDEDLKPMGKHPARTLLRELGED